MPRSIPTPIPLDATRAVALHAQALGAPLDPAPLPTPERLCEVVEQIGCVQIDTLQVVQRSQYLALWSRVGTYDPADFDRLIYAQPEGVNGRRLFEYWLHAASILPLSEYRYRLPAMRHHQDRDAEHWNRRWLRENGNLHLLDHVTERITQEGPLRASDFQHDGETRGSWWDWKPAKRALEILYDEGRLMIADRVNFQRVYDLHARVLPDWVDTTLPTPAETERYWIARGAQVFGLCQPMQTAEYAYLKRGQIKSSLAALVADGTLIEVEVELADGKTTPMIIHRDNLPLLQRALDGDLPAARTTFLSPFDSLFWPKDRDMQFWGVQQRLEAYKPASQRLWGYYCLPILHRDRIVGRFDPKLERKTGTLRLKALYLDAGFAPADSLISDVAAAMRDFLRFHAATELVIEHSDPPEFGAKLLAAL